MGYRVQSRARVKLTLELKLSNRRCYNDTIEEFDEYARKEAIKIVTNGIAAINDKFKLSDWKIMEHPEVTAIIARKRN